jgi:acetyl-CoA carboxylase biotin carboxyl carrier protein
MGFSIMDLKKIKKLIELLESSQLSELEIKEGDISIKLSRKSNLVPAQIPYDNHQIVSLTRTESAKDLQSHSIATLIDSTHYIRSPMVGTFYRSTAPEKPPLISVGDHVKIGDTLCIIEAMKILNFIQADKSGCIKKILVNNAEAVEFEQPLFIIE